MAGENLYTALQGLNITPSDTMWGVGTQAVAQAAPQLINPYGSVKSNLGIALGGTLLTALGAYQARKQAAEDSLQANRIGAQILSSLPEQRTALIEQESDPLIQSRLFGLNTQLAGAETSQRLQNQLEQAKAERDLNNQITLKAIEQGFIPKGKEDLFGGAANNANQFTSLKQQEEADKLRKEFSALPEVKNYSLIKTAAEIVGKAVKDPSAVATQELVRRAVQLIEPGMAVREGEQAAIMNSQSIPEQWKGQMQKALNGTGGLGEDVRSGILNIAQRAYESQAQVYKDTKSYYENLAGERRLPKTAISYLGDAPEWTKVVNATPKQINGDPKARLQTIGQRLEALASKESLTPEEKAEVDTLADEYRGIKNASTK